MKYGMRGYGIFWSIIEDLYHNANALPLDYESIAFELKEEKETIFAIINNFELFKIDDNNFSSASVQKRLDERNEKSELARKSANLRWNNANAMRPQCDSNAIKERKGKERKVKVYNNQIVPLKGGGRAKVYFGTWVDADNTGVKLITSEFPELKEYEIG